MASDPKPKIVSRDDYSLNNTIKKSYRSLGVVTDETKETKPKPKAKLVPEVDSWNIPTGRMVKPAKNKSQVTEEGDDEGANGLMKLPPIRNLWRDYPTIRATGNDGLGYGAQGPVRGNEEQGSYVKNQGMAEDDNGGK